MVKRVQRSRIHGKMLSRSQVVWCVYSDAKTTIKVELFSQERSLLLWIVSLQAAESMISVQHHASAFYAPRTTTYLCGVEW